MTMDAHQALARSLAEPPEKGDIDMLTNLWRHAEIRIECDRPHDLEDHPDLAIRIRGAFGRTLASLPPPVVHRRDPFQRPAPFAVFFGDFRVPAAQELPKPFVIDADCVGKVVIVTLRVFGHAMFWAMQARDALIMALEGGVSLRMEGRLRVAFKIRDCTSRSVDGLPTRDTAREAVMVFHSPLVVRSGRSFGLTETALIKGLFARVQGLARWQGLLLSPSQEAMRCVDTIQADLSGLDPAPMRRNSQRQPGMPILALGVVGRLRLSGTLAPLLAHLAIGSYAHIGSHAAVGFGRYDLALYA